MPSSRSLMHINFNSGPSTEPCGTPLQTVIQLDHLPLIHCEPEKNVAVYF